MVLKLGMFVKGFFAFIFSLDFFSSIKIYWNIIYYASLYNCGLIQARKCSPNIFIKQQAFVKKEW